MTGPQQIVITGISSELGSVLARGLGRLRGTQIIGTMRRPLRRKERFARNIAVVDRCDLTEKESCERVVEAAKEQFSGPFGLVHCVGDFWEHVPFLDCGTDQARRMVESHFVSLYNVLQSLVPVMRHEGGGSVVAFSCNSVRYNYPHMAVFTASKSAVDSLMRSLANELSGEQMRFNSLVLASLQTKKVLRSKPHGDYAHFIPPSDLVPVVRFLLSGESRWINGNAINLFVHSDEFYGSGYFERIAK